MSIITFFQNTEADSLFSQITGFFMRGDGGI